VVAKAGGAGIVGHAIDSRELVPVNAHVSFIGRNLEASLSKMCPMIIRGAPLQPQGLGVSSAWAGY
jgi:hypothetical protein